MQRIEVNVQTGERTVIQLTPQEVADAQVRAAAEASRPKIKTALELLEERITAIEQRLGA